MFLEDKSIAQIYELSKSQNLTAMCWYYLKKQGVYIDPKFQDKFEKECAKTIYIRTQQNNIYESLITLFEKNSIYFLPLKGLVIKDYYDVPALRFSCDLDILIHSKDLGRARVALEANGWTTDGKLNFHDIHFYKGQVHLELHFNICENMLNIDRILADVWKHVIIKNGYEYQMENTFFLYHQIAHAYYHYLNGGCGVKAVLDIRILREKLFYDKNKLNEYLQKSGIQDFYNDVVSLIDYWFEKKEPNYKNLEMEKFIIDGGSYGKKSNLIKSEAVPIFEKLIPPANVMYAYFPRLDTCHIMLPFCYFWRWWRALIHRIKKMI